jgi:hypothetical protein
VARQVFFFFNFNDAIQEQNAWTKAEILDQAIAYIQGQTRLAIKSYEDKILKLVEEIHKESAATIADI